MLLDDTVFIVTGAAGGIGATYARALSQAGARVAVADINIDDARGVAKDIQSAGATKAFYVDVASESSCLELADAVAAEFGSIDGLVNNAALFGGLKMVDWMTIDVEYWNKIVAVNLTSVVLCTRAVVPFMKLRGRGKIVNQASIAGLVKGNHYSLTKRGVIELTGALAKELGQFAININAIAPGVIGTDAMLSLDDGRGASIVDHHVESAQVFKRRATPDDLVGTLLYLCSAASDWVTGQTIVVDAGSTLNLA